MDTPTGSSDIWVPFHQVHHLPVLSKVCFSFSFSACPPCKFPAFPIDLVTFMIASGWKSTSPSRASRNVFSALTFKHVKQHFLAIPQLHLFLCVRQGVVVHQLMSKEVVHVHDLRPPANRCSFDSQYLLVIQQLKWKQDIVLRKSAETFVAYYFQFDH